MPILKKIKPFFTDNRGEMSHLIGKNININSAVLITCKKGAIRANHYHKKDSHFAYVLKGKMIYYYKVADKEKVRKITVNEGSLVYTPPNEIHAMKFPVDSIFIALTTEERQRNQYEEDTVRVKFI
jgi:quercetin dioxygenase-like cupin family protein